MRKYSSDAYLVSVLSWDCLMKLRMLYPTLDKWCKLPARPTFSVFRVTVILSSSLVYCVQPGHTRVSMERRSVRLSGRATEEIREGARAREIFLNVQRQSNHFNKMLTYCIKGSLTSHLPHSFIGCIFFPINPCKINAHMPIVPWGRKRKCTVTSAPPPPWVRKPFLRIMQKHWKGIAFFIQPT